MTRGTSHPPLKPPPNFKPFELEALHNRAPLQTEQNLSCKENHGPTPSSHTILSASLLLTEGAVSRGAGKGCHLIIIITTSFLPDAFWFTSIASLVAYRAEPKWEAIVVMATDTSTSVRARLDADVKGV